MTFSTQKKFSGYKNNFSNKENCFFGQNDCERLFLNFDGLEAGPDQNETQEVGILDGIEKGVRCREKFYRDKVGLLQSKVEKLEKDGGDFRGRLEGEKKKLEEDLKREGLLREIGNQKILELECKVLELDREILKMKNDRKFAEGRLEGQRSEAKFLRTEINVLRNSLSLSD